MSEEQVDPVSSCMYNGDAVREGIGVAVAEDTDGFDLFAATEYIKAGCGDVLSAKLVFISVDEEEEDA